MIDYKKHIQLITLIVLVFIGSFIVHTLILGGHSTVKLEHAGTISGLVAQDTSSINSQNKLQTPGKDFSLNNIKFFDNDNWAVANYIISETKESSSTIVLKKIQGTLQIILGPGTAFSSDSLQSMPPDVAEYLKNNGAVYGTTN